MSAPDLNTLLAAWKQDLDGLTATIARLQGLADRGAIPEPGTAGPARNVRTVLRECRPVAALLQTKLQPLADALAAEAGPGAADDAFAARIADLRRQLPVLAQRQHELQDAIAALEEERAQSVFAGRAGNAAATAEGGA